MSKHRHLLQNFLLEKELIETENKPGFSRHDDKEIPISDGWLRSVFGYDFRLWYQRSIYFPCNATISLMNLISAWPPKTKNWHKYMVFLIFLTILVVKIAIGIVALSIHLLTLAPKAAWKGIVFELAKVEWRQMPLHHRWT